MQGFIVDGRLNGAIPLPFERRDWQERKEDFHEGKEDWKDILRSNRIPVHLINAMENNGWFFPNLWSEISDKEFVDMGFKPGHIVIFKNIMQQMEKPKREAIQKYALEMDILLIGLYRYGGQQLSLVQFQALRNLPIIQQLERAWNDPLLRSSFSGAVGGGLGGAVGGVVGVAAGAVMTGATYGTMFGVAGSLFGGIIGGLFAFSATNTNETSQAAEYRHTITKAKIALHVTTEIEITPQLLKKRYKHLAKLYHPDVNRNYVHANQQFQELSQYYIMLLGKYGKEIETTKIHNEIMAALTI